jgi:hypothetical protein
MMDRSSAWAAACRVPLDREQRACFRAKSTFKCFRRVGMLTLAAVAVGRILIDKLGYDGRLDPSIKTLAKLAGVASSTVVLALDRLRKCGFVTWCGGWRGLGRGSSRSVTLTRWRYPAPPIRILRKELEISLF